VRGAHRNPRLSLSLTSETGWKDPYRGRYQSLRLEAPIFCKYEFFKNHHKTKFLSERFSHEPFFSDCERTTDDRSRLRCLDLTSLFALFVFLLCRLTSGAFTIDSSTPTLRINLNEHTILYYIVCIF
jgi:hypothetical protein